MENLSQEPRFSGPSKENKLATQSNLSGESGSTTKSISLKNHAKDQKMPKVNGAPPPKQLATKAKENGLKAPTLGPSKPSAGKSGSGLAAQKTRRKNQK